MLSINPYLNFDGTTREAMTFYHQVLGGAIRIQTFAEVGQGHGAGGERIMHAHLESGPVIIMASDTMPGMTLVAGNNFYININCETVEEIDRLFGALGAGGKVQMELQDTFWGARFGMLSDKFGINWMFNCELQKK